MGTPIIVGAYEAPWALLMLVTSAIDRQAWEHGNMWHVAGGGCLYKFILNCTFNLEVHRRVFFLSNNAQSSKQLS
jgi:hypothetical protein